VKNKRGPYALYSAAALVIMLACLMSISCSKTGSYPKATVSGAEVVVDTQTLSPDVPRFFTHRFRDKSINFFVIKINNNVLSFLDACKSCNPKLGFRFDNGHFTCKVCNTRYSVAEVEHGIGGCFPIRVPGAQRGNSYYIPVSAFEQYYSSF